MAVGRCLSSDSGGSILYELFSTQLEVDGSKEQTCSLDGVAACVQSPSTPDSSWGCLSCGSGGFILPTELHGLHLEFWENTKTSPKRKFAAILKYTNVMV
ncbi:17031_t:CDS:2 [Gigaspora rosea]|nr:17031_t:CDS:2 [Gigaspora rosea]